jgi:hypothetical protein
MLNSDLLDEGHCTRPFLWYPGLLFRVMKDHQESSIGQNSVLLHVVRFVDPS